jgi:hypothetical protein
MKKVKLLFYCFLLCQFLHAQSILPATTSEVCPGTDIVFTVTIPAVIDNNSMGVASGIGAPVIVQFPTSSSTNNGVTTFNFTGRFVDVNVDQAFRVTWRVQNVNNEATFTFTKVKSLAHGSLTPIQPSPLSISIPRCQTGTANITFSNVQWKNISLSPATGFGSITTYEYLLPVGWSIGSTVSNGSNWIAGNNAVTVTADATASGNGGSIQIRAVNPCGSNLIKGQPAFISISRPGATAITGGVANLCSGTSTYTLNVIPTGASVSWSLSNTTVASISGSSTGNSVTIAKGTGDGNTVLSAMVTDCSGTYGPINFTIAVGGPGNITLQANPTINDFCATGLMQFDVSLDNPSAGISYSWVVTGSGAKLKFGANTNHPILFMQTTGTFSITGTVTNSCGSSNYSAIDLNSETYYFLYCGSFFVSVFPNPAKSNMTLSLSKPTKENDIVSVKLYSQRNTQVIRQWRFKGEQKQFNLNIKDVRKGIYILEVMINGKKDAKTIVVN